MASKLRVVLDTNVFMVSVLPHHKYWWVFDGILKDQYNLLVGNEILTEYLEKCIVKYGPTVSNERLDFLLEFPNVELITPFYRFNLIHADPDDNKYVDCAIAGQADYIVSHDGHFDVLRDIPFPKVTVIKLDEFKRLLEESLL